MINNILDLTKTLTKEYFNKYTYPWDLITNINEIITDIDKSNYTEISPNIWIGQNVKIDSSAKIIGPCIIDDNTEIKHCAYIRENVIIGKNCTIGNSTELKSSILFDEVAVPHYNYVGNSILGYKSHLGAGAITSNLKSNKTNIKITINDKSYETNCRKFGAIIGDYTEIGCNSVLNPGTVIGKNTIIYPLTMVRGEIHSNKIVKNNNIIIERKDILWKYI